MTNDQIPTLVLKDAAGSYSLLPLETLEQGRVPEDRKDEVERLIAESDVSGYARQLYEVVTTVIWAAELGAMTLGNVLANAYFQAAYGSRDDPTWPA